jgi:hypothetical protein
MLASPSSRSHLADPISHEPRPPPLPVGGNRHALLTLPSAADGTAPLDLAVASLRGGWAQPPALGDHVAVRGAHEEAEVAQLVEAAGCRWSNERRVRLGETGVVVQAKDKPAPRAMEGARQARSRGQFGRFAEEGGGAPVPGALLRFALSTHSGRVSHHWFPLAALVRAELPMAAESSRQELPEQPPMLLALQAELLALPTAALLTRAEAAGVTHVAMAKASQESDDPQATIVAQVCRSPKSAFNRIFRTFLSDKPSSQLIQARESLVDIDQEL